MDVILFKFGQVARGNIPGADLLIGTRVVLDVNGQWLVKSAQAFDQETGELTLIVRPVVVIPGILEGEAAVEAERDAALRAGAAWRDMRAFPLTVTWENGG